MRTNRDITNYDDSVKTTKARHQKSHVFDRDQGLRDITPTKSNKNGSFFLNFKVFDSTVINEDKGVQGVRQSHDEPHMTHEDNLKLPKIKPLVNRLDNKISTYTNNYNGAECANTSSSSKIPQVYFNRNENSKSVNLLKHMNKNNLSKLKYFQSTTGDRSELSSSVLDSKSRQRNTSNTRAVLSKKVILISMNLHL